MIAPSPPSCSWAESRCRPTKYPPIKIIWVLLKVWFHSFLAVSPDPCLSWHSHMQGTQPHITVPGRRRINDARKLALAAGTPLGQIVTCRSSRHVHGTTSAVPFHTSSRGATRLIWQHRLLFISLINFSGFLLFHGTLAHTHLYTMECVLSLSFSRRWSTHLTSESSFDWFCFPFFLWACRRPIVKYEQRANLWRTVSLLLSWRPVASNDGITLTVLYSRQTMPLQGMLLIFYSFASVVVWIFRSCGTLLSLSPRREHFQSWFLQLVVFFRGYGDILGLPSLIPCHQVTVDD